MNGQGGRQMDGWEDGWMTEQMDKWMDGCWGSKLMLTE